MRKNATTSAETDFDIVKPEKPNQQFKSIVV
jgi:hypothetical protein